VTVSVTRVAAIRAAGAVAGGAGVGVGVGLGVGVGADSIGDASARAQVVGTLAAFTAFGGAARLLAQQQPLTPRAANVTRAVGALGVTAMLTTALVLGPRLNTIDDGLNALEDSGYRRTFAKVAIASAAAGLVAGAVGGGIMARGGGAARATGAIAGSATGAMLASSLGILGLSLRQEAAFQPSETAVESVARTLHGHRGRSLADHFYVRADASGDEDGTTSLPEVERAVAAFDTDQDGHVRGGAEWAALHASIVATSR
jgi:hypothetical protein